MSRIGPGKLKHIEAATLYIQEKVKNKMVSLHKILGIENGSDVLTKHVARDILQSISTRWA